jgi:photosystem II stability/assembly factor-like uncharacterized protein
MERIIRMARVIHRELVTRLWRRLSAAHWAVRAGLVALIACSALGAGAAFVMSSRAATGVPKPTLFNSANPKTLAGWYQQSHYGERKPAASSRVAALRQAARLPHLAPPTQPQGATAPRIAVPPATGSWMPLGAQPLSQASFGEGLFTTGNTSGEITAIAVNPADANTIWIGSASGGVWHTADGGTTWEPMTDSQATPAIGSLALDPTNSTTLYAGTGDPNAFFGGAYPGIGVLKTTDAGHSWTVLGSVEFSGLAIGRIAIDPLHPQTLLVSVGWDGTGAGNPNKTGIWRSTDGGLTWTQVLSDASQPALPDAGTDVAFDPADSSVAYAGLGNLFAANATTASGLYKSTDNGQTWAQIATVPTGSNVERVSLGVSADGAHVYAVMTDGDFRDFPVEPSFGDVLNLAVYTSTNHGVTWQARPATNFHGTFQDKPLWWYSSFLMVDPADTTGNTIYAGSNETWRSSDGGVTWTDITFCATSLPRPNHTVAPFGTAGDFYIGTYGGIWSAGVTAANCTGSATGAYFSRNGVAPHGLSLLRFTSGSIGGAGAIGPLSGGAFDFGGAEYARRTPTGESFEPTEPGSWFQPDLYSQLVPAPITVVDGTPAPALAGDPVYDETITNGHPSFNRWLPGVGWQPIFPFILGTDATHPDTDNIVYPLVLSPNVHTELFTATDRVYRSTDQLATLKPISPVLDPAAPCAVPSDPGCVPISSLAVANGNDDVIYVGDDAGQLSVTTDGGVSWRTATRPCVSCGVPISSIAVDPTNPQIIYVTLPGIATSAGTHIFKSADGGTTWADVSLTLPNASFVSVTISPSDAGFVLAGSDIGAFASADGGATWYVLGNGLPTVGVNQIFTNHDGSDVYVATEGRGMWKLAAAHLAVSPAAVTASVLFGGNPAPQTFTLSDLGWSSSGSVSWSLAAPLPSWLSLSAASGVVTPSAPQQTTLSFQMPSAPGTYSTVLAFSAAGSDNTEFDIPVSVTVSASHVSVSPGSFSITTIPGKSPASQTFTVSNSGTIPLNWATQPLPTWLSLTPTSGTVAPGASQTVQLDFHIPPTDGPQTYTTIIAFSDPHADDSPFNVPVTVVTAAPAKTWYFAEGTTNTGFNEYLTVANPGTAAAHVQVQYLLGLGAPIVKSYIVAAHTRFTANVNSEIGAGKNVAMVVTSDQPIVAERPMYFDYAGVASGSDVLGATSLNSTFNFAYLDTTAQHTTWLVVLNQNAFAVDVNIAYFPATGGPALRRVHSVAASSRGSFQVNVEGLPVGSYSATVTLTQSGTATPASGLVERPMYLIDATTGFQGAATVVGVSTPQADSYFAEGFVSNHFDERYILANPCDPAIATCATAHVTITFQLADGSAAFTGAVLAPGQQKIIEAIDFLGSVSNSAVVHSDVPIVAERFMSFAFDAVIHGASEAIGARAPGDLFYFAEGFTGGAFNEFLTIQNPDATRTAVVTVTFLPATASAPPLVKVYTVAPHSRFTLKVNDVIPGQSVSLVVESNVPIVAERPMYFVFAPDRQGGTDVVGYQP